MDKKFLSCLSYALLLTISFLLGGFTEAARLPQKSFSLVGAVSVADAFAIYTPLTPSFCIAEEMEEQAVFGLQQQTELYAVAPQTAVSYGQSDLIRKFPTALLFLCRLKLGYWLSADAFPSFSPVSLYVTPGFPVYFRSLRL